MNIFTKIIHTSNQEIKNLFIKELGLSKDSRFSNEIYSKSGEDFHTTLIFGDEYQKNIDEIKNHFEIIGFYHIGEAFMLIEGDIKLGDIIIPNTFFDRDDHAIFLENHIDNNYDLNNFGLLLNGMCLTLDHHITDKEEIEEIKSSSLSELFDFEGYTLGKVLEENNLLKSATFIKIIGTDESYCKNALGILEVMMG